VAVLLAVWLALTAPVPPLWSLAALVARLFGQRSATPGLTGVDHRSLCPPAALGWLGPGASAAAAAGAGTRGTTATPLGPHISEARVCGEVTRTVALFGL
jgi:hypothetical protein